MNVVIIGNSAAGLNALESFRAWDTASPLTMISLTPAYSRVLLPYFLREIVPYENLFIRRADYYDRLGARIMFGKRVERVREKRHSVEFEDATEIPYDRLLIATGSHPVMPPIRDLKGPGVFHFWNLEDAEKLKPYFRPGKRLLVLGSGFVSLQAAWAACQRGLEVTVFELVSRIMPRVLDEQGAEILHRKIVEHGVDLRVGTVTEGIERQNDGTIRVFVKGHPPLVVDFVIVGTGVRPNVQFLEGCPVEIDGGILVNRKLETNVEGIYAAGDVAAGPTVFGEDHAVHAFWPTAVEHGKIAGANMAGRDREYPGSLNMNVTEMFGITVASMGVFGSGNGLEQYTATHKDRYIKILLRKSVPVGGVVLGDSEDALLLGFLRPIIRQGKMMDDLPGLVESRSYWKGLAK